MEAKVRFLLIINHIIRSLGDKLSNKYTDDDSNLRQQRIDRARERDNLKAFVGMKLQSENQKLLEMSKQLAVAPRAYSNNGRATFKIGSGFSQAGQSIAGS